MLCCEIGAPRGVRQSQVLQSYQLLVANPYIHRTIPHTVGKTLLTNPYIHHTIPTCSSTPGNVLSDRASVTLVTELGPHLVSTRRSFDPNLAPRALRYHPRHQ